MTRDAFLARLGELLPEGDSEEILADYREHFTEGNQAGRSDEEICRKLGRPEDLARDFRERRLLQSSEERMDSRLALALIRAARRRRLAAGLDPWLIGGLGLMAGSLGLALFIGLFGSLEQDIGLGAWLFLIAGLACAGFMGLVMVGWGLEKSGAAAREGIRTARAAAAEEQNGE